MFNYLIKLALEYNAERSKLNKIIATANKQAEKFTPWHSACLQRLGLKSQSKIVDKLGAQFINACWDYYCDPMEVMTMAKWIRRHKIGELRMDQWLPLARLL